MSRIRISKTDSGPPTTGYWEVGDFIRDKQNQEWSCTVTGKPGTWQQGNSGAITKTSLGLGNVDNTSDLNKPVSTAQAAAIAGVTKTSLGLDQVNNTSDANKPVSSAQSAAISSAIAGLTKSSVGLSNVDNTSDLNKPVSTAAISAFEPNRSYDFERDFSAPTDGVSDATTALQNAINTIVTAGGGKLKCKSRTYNITNITWPSVPLTSPTVTVEIEGSFAPQTVPFCPGTGGNSFNVPALAGGTIFKTSATSGDTFGGLVAISNMMVVFRRLIVRAPGNPQCNGIHGGWLLNMVTEDVAVDTGGSTGSGVGSVTQPTNTGTFGIIYPGVGNGGTVQARNTSVQGFGIGLAHNEHFIGDNVTVFKNLVGIRVLDGFHSARYGRISLYWNVIGLQARLNSDGPNNDPTKTTPVTRLAVDQLDTEETDEAVAWYKTTAHIDDPLNRFRGHINFHRVVPNVGIQGYLLRNGGAFLNLTPVGISNRIVYDAVGFQQNDSATTLPNSFNGVAPTVLRGTWGTSGRQAYIATTTASDCIAAWSTGQSSVLLHTKITTNSSGSRAVGSAINVIDGSNFILVEISSSSTGFITIQKVVSGTYTTLGSGAFPNAGATTYDMIVAQSGGKIRVYMNSGLILSVNLSSSDWTTFSAGTSHGLYSWTGTGFDTGTSRWGMVSIEAPGIVGF